jgi:glutathione S-transferase
MRIRRLVLHHFPTSRSARVRWALHECVGDAFETVRVDLYRGAQYRSEFLALNANHAVPVLEVEWDDGRVQRLVESAALVAFLADAYPDRGLAPPPGASPERADYLQMLQFGATTADHALWQVRIHEHVLPEAERDPRTAARYRRKFGAEIEPQLARRLEAGPWICGEAFTAADCVIGHDVVWARIYGMCAGEPFDAYLDRLAARPAFAAAFADAHEFVPAVPQVPGRPSRFSG